MEKYIALLRGVNVGGKNKIDMKALKIVFETLGFDHVKTYINSGNILFESKHEDLTILQTLCEDSIKAHFLLDVKVLIISVKTLSDTLNHAPTWWDEQPEDIHYAIFLLPSIHIDEVYQLVGAIKPDLEHITHHDQVIFWSTTRKNFPKTRWSKIAASKANAHVTIRNANTVKKLLALANLSD